MRQVSFLLLDILIITIDIDDNISLLVFVIDISQIAIAIEDWRLMHIDRPLDIDAFWRPQPVIIIITPLSWLRRRQLSPPPAIIFIGFHAFAIGWLPLLSAHIFLAFITGHITDYFQPQITPPPLPIE